MRYSIFHNMIHGDAISHNHPHKGAGQSKSKLSKPECKVIRIGGHKLREQKSIERRLKGIEAGDCVALEYGGNYCEYDWAAISSYPDADHSPAVSFGQFRETYSYAISRLQAIGAHVALLTLPAMLPQRYFDHISRNLNHKHILHWLGDDVCNLSRWREEFNDEILSLASQHQLPVIDISKALLQRSHAEDGYANDGMHPNSTGHGIIAELVANWQRSQA